MNFEEILENIPSKLRFRKPTIEEWSKFEFKELLSAGITKDEILQRLKRHLKVFTYYGHNSTFVGKDIDIALYFKFRDIFKEYLENDNVEDIVLEYVYDKQENYVELLEYFEYWTVVKELIFKILNIKDFNIQSIIEKYYDIYLIDKKFKDYNRNELKYFSNYRLLKIENMLKECYSFTTLTQKMNKYNSSEKEFLFIKKYIKQEYEKRYYQYVTFKKMLDRYQVDTDDLNISVDDLRLVFKWYNKDITTKTLIDKVYNKDPFELLFKEIYLRYVEVEAEGERTQMYMNVSGAEVIKRLKVFMNLNGNNICKVTAKIKLPDGRERNLTIQNKFLNTIIFEFEESFTNFMEFYDDSMPINDDTVLLENSKVIELLITMRTVKIKKGILHYELYEYNKELYFISYPETINRCILESCLLNNPNRDNLYKSFHTHEKKYEEAKDYESQIKIVEQYLEVKITKSDRCNFNYQDDDSCVNLYLSGNHAGRLQKLSDVDINNYPLNKNYKPLEFETLDDVNIITYDCEWHWLVDSNGIIRNGEPCLISYCIRGNDKLKIDAQHGVLKSFSEFYTIIDNFKDKPYSTYMYSHNGSSVEHYFIIKEFIKNSDKGIKFMKEFKNVSGTKIKSFKIRKINFRDSLLYLDCTLEEAAHLASTYSKFTDHPELLELKKAMEDPNISIKKTNLLATESWYLNKKWDYDNEDDYNYSLLDSLSLMDILLGLNKNLIEIYRSKSVTCDLPDNAFMLKTASISAVVKDCIYDLIGNKINTAFTEALSEKLYIGGNNQTFYVDTYIKPGFILDINSSYPHQLTKPIPGEILRVDKCIKHRHNELWLGLFKLHYKDTYRPKHNLLCMKQSGRLIFPTIETPSVFAMTDFEYEYLKDNIIIDEVIYVLHCKKCIGVAPFMKNQFKSRLQVGKKTGAGIAKKVFMNRGYGAMATNKRRNVKVLNHKDNVYLNSKLMDISTYAKVDCEFSENLQWTTYNQFSLPDNMRHTAAYITALARFQLYQMIVLLDAMGFKCIYCDTDSVFVLGDYNTFLKVMYTNIKNIIDLKIYFLQNFIIEPHDYNLINNEDIEKYFKEVIVVKENESEFVDLFSDIQTLGAWSCEPKKDIFKEITIYACKDYKYTTLDGLEVVKQKGQSEKYYEWRRSLGKMDFKLIHQNKEFTRINRKGNLNSETKEIEPFII